MDAYIIITAIGLTVLAILTSPHLLKYMKMRFSFWCVMRFLLPQISKFVALSK